MTHEISIYDHNTGQTVVREMTADELAAHEAGLEQSAKIAAQIEKTAEARKSALAKLGLTDAEIKALGL